MCTLDLESEMPFDNPQVSESKCTQALRAAFALISNEEGWVQGRNHVWSLDHTRIRYCSIGAINDMYGQFSAQSIMGAHQCLLDVCPWRDIMAYNDSINHKELCIWWNKAIDWSIKRDNELQQ